MQVPKPSFKRRTPKIGSISKITQEVRREVLQRSNHQCERCGISRAYAFEMAHLISASQGGRGDDPANVVLLCGPSVNTGTCHNFADYTAAGREWRKQKRRELMFVYER